MNVAKRQHAHEIWLTEKNELASDFNPSPLSEGWELYEHWQIDKDGEPYLCVITSSVYDVGDLDPGDFILRRRWGAAGVPEIVKHARPAGE
ncbi:hypothetical protein SEA_LOZINAK_122 [Gordonia phage Lozinak]|uniref:Uncharacterized protein n=4 Tax=Smoothievirus TaxID=1982557 RepID=A0A2D1GFW5_9CAUD|nr:hypothetical protein BEN60_gp084 [Gordonia phage Smoothie]YP_009276235.1 hypothetical protein BH772_gp087 [Gordonia phage Bachita]ATN90748.1 hypothetical protein SEA_LOZINAK_122 [Gordonia phage Lozinak]QAU06986.1 hypothetical protein SEA_APHELION_122 [Gordonia phage Aphelion]QKY79699.1 hypothetical protein SEA_ENGINEER_123 [Gordonia Phage Engineer]ANA86279.1 hypothetical protein PBI_SMOOTHIE_123 [Gordonia phage Smoothie]ANA86799.1 hypothetical protein PBI_BACHITA_124 [Gordonia phage Bachit